MNKETLDDKLFLPLTEFFNSNSVDRVALTEFISARGAPDGLNAMGQKIGFVFEEYVKLLLKRFNEATGIPLLESAVEREIVEGGYGGYILNKNKWGQVIIRDALGKNSNVAELDGLYEFHDGGEVFPIIFEIYFKKRHIEGNSRYKTELRKAAVGKLYSNAPWLCRIRPARKLSKPGLYKREGTKYKEDGIRTIIIPNTYEMGQAAENI